MTIKIVVDSASDILPEQAKQMGMIHVPLMVTFDGVPYQDGVTITHKEFYEKLIESDVLPSTSQASPAAFSAAFEEALKEADYAVCIAVSSGLSGTYQSACIAADDFDGKVFVIDSQSVCIGQRILAERAVDLIHRGVEIQELVDTLNREKYKIRVLAALDTLEYLKKGGRISAATAFAGGLLAIKPVVTVKDGLVVMAGKARGSKNVNNMLRELVCKGNGVDFSVPYCLGYSGLSDHLIQKYIEDSEDIWKPYTTNLPVHTVGCVIGTHVGPGAIAVAFFEK